MIEAALDVDTSRPAVAEVRDFLLNQAMTIQSGGAEYPFSHDWLGMYWPTDEYIFIKLTADKKLGQFLSEVGGLVKEVIGPRGDAAFFAAFEDALRLNVAMIKQPFASQDISVTSDSDVLGFYRAALRGERLALDHGPTVTHIER